VARDIIIIIIIINGVSIITTTSCDIAVWSTTHLTQFELTNIRLVNIVNNCYKYVKIGKAIPLQALRVPGG
jgi:predicted nuclease of predicted toxin-antitoxin system